NQILDLSKIESGTFRLDTEPVDPRALVREIVELMEPRAREGGLQLWTLIEPGLPERILTDPVRLRQMLLNLVSNAIKFTHDGSVTILAGVDRDDPGRLWFDVEDSGIGLTKEQCQRIFEPFEQADSGTTRRYGGTGLGLSITQRLARLMGGEVSVRSAESLGSCFRISIPAPVADETVAPERPSAPSIPSPTLKGTRILLVEDGLDNQRLIAIHLRRAGALVVVADDGRHALDLTESDIAFDAVVMDMQMPRLDGYDTTRAMRERGRSWPIVAVTANARQGDRERCLDAGCDDYLPKPIDAPRLVETLARLVNETRTAS
ncbi:MAG: response regulator, partial [Phycisphaerales bacterium]|nr:response regulator [Phycisphaerales bacterium]